ncbi:hypothetical protein VE03_01303 [Pseudogymnoascus sp. 23342-1-I1]|nr:hypothetical protein VE03_01303 [Pseudogymnoascus sp. 23342-1-I1]
MKDVIGAIDASINLAEHLHTLVKSYADAPETAASMRLFDSQLSTVRLRLLQTALDRDTNSNIPGNRKPVIKEARKAVPLLQNELKGAIDQLESLQTDRVTGRIMWAIWKGERVTEIFNGIHRKIDVIESYRVLFLLPENAERNQQQTLRDLICSSTIVPLETRFSFALQLAEALLKIHLAGLMHCEIRSDNIIFLAP